MRTILASARPWAALLALVLTIVWAHAALAADSPPKKKTGQRWEKMDYGPFLTASIRGKGPGNNNTAMKGVAVPLGDDGPAAICFDEDLLRVSAAWTGKFLNLRGTPFDGSHGSWPEVAGSQAFGTKPSPGWSRGDDFEDPRPEPFGSLPADWGRFLGLYIHGEHVVLSYQVGGTKILESPGVEHKDDLVAFTRTFNIEPSAKPLALVVADSNESDSGVGPVDAKDNANAKDTTGAAESTIARLGEVLAGVVHAPPGATWEITDSGKRIVLKLPASAAPTQLRLVVAKIPAAKRAEFAALLKAAEGAPLALADWTRGGPARWAETIETKGKRGNDDGPFAVDTITPPEDNVYEAWMRFGGLDFFKDGRAALSTWSGDVWIVSGIDDNLEKLTWKRFATGLFQPLGLRIFDDKVYVLGREGIVRLNDLNGDGEADFYETINSDIATTTGFHEFAFDLHTDPEGNFYYAKGGPVAGGGRGFERIAANHGAVIRVSKDGKTMENYATGFRAPNGIGVGPNGEVTTGDNEGTWTPKCRLNWVKPHGFYGVVDLAHQNPKPNDYDKPLCWFPKDIDNSGGGQVWLTTDKFAPFNGRLLHMSYGTSSLFLVMKEEIDGQVQGGVVKLPINFDSGIMRARVNPHDGLLYVAGLRGWQTNAARDCAFQRVRRTDKPANMPTELHVEEEGIALTFTDPLDKTAAEDPGNYSVEQWNYLWCSEYGSDDYSAKTHNFEQKTKLLNELRLNSGKNVAKISELTKELKKGRDSLRVRSAKVSEDGKTVTLELRNVKPVMQMMIKCNLKAADGKPVNASVYNTINIVP